MKKILIATFAIAAIALSAGVFVYSINVADVDAWGTGGTSIGSSGTGSGGDGCVGCGSTSGTSGSTGSSFTGGTSIGSSGTGSGGDGCIGCGSTTYTSTPSVTYTPSSSGGSSSSGSSSFGSSRSRTDDNDRTNEPSTPKPVCKWFKVSDKQVLAGERVQLTWKTANAKKVQLVKLDTGKRYDVVKNQGNGHNFQINEDTRFRLVVYGFDGSKDNHCEVAVKVQEPKVPQCVSFTANQNVLPVGDNGTKLKWTTKNASKVQIVNLNTSERITVGNNNSSGKWFSINEKTSYRLVVYGADGSKDNHCELTVKVKTPTPDPKECKMKITKSVNKSYAKVGDQLTYRINVKNIGDGDCTGGGVKIVDQIDSNIDFVRDYHTGEVSGGYGNKPVYDSGSHTLYWNAHTLTPGESVTIDWVGEVENANKCDYTVYNTAKVTAKELNNFNTWVTSNRVSTQIDGDCTTPKAPRCVFFNASPDDLPEGGGNVSLSWATENADSVILNPGNRSVAKSDSDYDVYTSDDTTYTLTLKADGFNDVTCYAHVDVDEDTPSSSISCAKNVDVWKASDYTVNKGSDIKLTWETHGLDSVSITDLGNVSDDGSETVNIDNDTTYVLTGRKDGKTIRCEIDVDVETGGSGGGSRNPRCEFDASDTTIDAGDEITLSWETKYGRELTIYEGDEGDDKIYETDDDDTVDEGEIKVRPTKDTTYTLVVERGSRDRKCDVDIKVDDKEVVVLNAKRTQGQVAGISLTQVPYTGFEAGPMLTFIFYAVLAIWGMFVAYFLVVRKDTVMGVSLAGAQPRGRVISDDLSTPASYNEPEASEAAAYVGSVLAPEPVATRDTQMTVPSNLPTGIAPVGYAAAIAEVETEDDESRQMKDIEDLAHENRILLSSDAIRHFIAACPREDGRLAAFTKVLENAKTSFPSEDGWTVLNVERLGSLMETPVVEAATVPAGAGSLAEAIVAGNIAAAYQMIGNRPMVALADAAADLDTVYRGRGGEQVIISDMLASESARLETAQIKEAIVALTGALDGTYTDEAEAVKMAILKAVKATS